MADSELKSQALSSQHDFYELLGISASATESEIRRAYRKTALKYHPDKVGADEVKLETFHLLQIANDVLLDPLVRQLYDNARKAREEKKERESAYGDRRKQLIDELERREKAGVVGVKRAREETQEEELFQRELKRLAADGARRRKEREEQLRREHKEQMISEQGSKAELTTKLPKDGLEDIDRTIKFRFPAEASIDHEELRTRFSRFGSIQDIVTKDKKIKPEGEKHRKDYKIGMIVYESIVGAHAAITDMPALAEMEKQLAIFEALDWASGKVPDCVPRLKGSMKTFEPGKSEKAPSFSSFKSIMKDSGGATLEEQTMMRLKQAERKRLLEKLKHEDEDE